VAYALELAKNLGARLHLLHAIHEPADASGFSTPHVSLDKAREEAKGRLERRLRLYATSQLVGFTNFVAEVAIGPPHNVIARYADDKDIDLIIIGERRKGKLAQALSQKTTNKILESSNRPILRLIISD
jgi:nucleotide-binding universal stress UspA family protein